VTGTKNVKNVFYIYAPGRSRTTWMKVIQQELKSNNLSLNQATNVGQNRPLWRLMSTHSWLCMPEKKKKK